MASFVPTKTGKCRAMVRRKGFSKSKVLVNMTEAQKWARRVEADYEAGRAIMGKSVDKMTVGDLIRMYATVQKPIKKWSKAKDDALRRADMLLGGTMLSRVNIKEAYEEAGYGPVSVDHQLSALSQVYKWGRTSRDLAIDEQTVKDAAAALRDAGLCKTSSRRDRRPTQEELDRLRDYFNGQTPQTNQHLPMPMVDLIDFAVETAMRVGEICRIEWTDVDFQAKAVIIRDRKHPTEKLGNHQRIALLGRAPEIIKAQPRADARVFPFHPEVVSRKFKAACAKLEIKDLVFHDLRHEGVSRLFEAGYRIEQVAHQSGHKDWKMLARYTAVRAEDLHR